MESDTNSYELAEPLERLGAEPETEVPAKYAKIASKMGSLYPPTNRRLVIGALAFWCKRLGPNDPIVQAMVSWVWYLSDDDRSQFEAGLDTDHSQELNDRIEELGLPDPDDV